MYNRSRPVISTHQPGAAFVGAGTAILAALFLGIAIWNGFPLMYYDTGAYIAQGLAGVFLPERSPVYSLLLLFSGGGFSLWLVVILQAAMTGYLVTLTARFEVPGLTLARLSLLGVSLMLLTGMGWYVGQVVPDCFTGLLCLGAYLLLFRSGQMGPATRAAVIAITALSIASHPSHLGLIGGFLILGAVLRGLVRVWPALPRPRLKLASLTLIVALGITLASNFALANSVFISRSGSVFLFARLIQDGIIKRLLDDTCPQSHYTLCPHKDRLPHTANSWLWGDNRLFHAQGGFANSKGEDSRMIAESLHRYPMMHVRMALYDSVLQFFSFRTGDEIESQAWVLQPVLAQHTPGQLAPYLAARQQREHIRFETLNMVHVTVGMLALLGLALLLQHAAWRERWNEAALPGLVLAGLLGNAIICGTFSNPHDRYQSRVMWLPVLALLLARARDKRALQPAQESGT